MSEHGRIGAQFSSAGHGQDIRLACHGLDKNDNDFVIGLVGPQLHPLSIMVQTMRKTRQTSEFLEELGPFLVGKAVWQRTPKGRMSKG
jgi:chlorite dismutase